MNENTKHLVFGLCMAIALLGAFVGGASAVFNPEGYMGTVIGKDAENNTFEVQTTHNWSDTWPFGEWQSNNTTTEWLFPNVDAMNEICVGDYVEILGFAASPAGDVIGLGRMNSSTEMVITDIYGDPAFLEPYWSTEPLDPPLLGNFTIEYNSTPNCSNCDMCNCEASYTNVTITNGTGQVEVDDHRLYPGQGYTYVGAECRINITFHSGEASACPVCNDTCVGPHPISDFTIHIEAVNQPPTTLRGDVNRDGNITPADALICLQIAAGSRPCDAETLAAADVSGDNRVTSLDALMILQKACGKVAEKTHLRIGYLPSTHQLAEMVAMEKGWLEEDLAEFGITEVTDHQFPSGPPEMQSMMAGNLDVAYVGVTPPITAIAQGLDARIVAAVQTQGSDLVLRPAIADNYTSPSNLSGLTIATFPPGSVQDIVLKKFLTDNNVSNVTIVPMDPGNATTAIASGAVDGVFLPHPCPAIIELEDNGVSVVRSGEMWADHACCCLLVSGELIRNHPDMVKEIVRTHIKATEYVNENQNESAEIFAEKIGHDLDTVKYSIEQWDGEWISDPHLELECAIEFANISYDLGYVDRLLTAEDLFDLSFYDEIDSDR